MLIMCIHEHCKTFRVDSHLFKTSFAFFCGQFVHPFFLRSLATTRIGGVSASSTFSYWIQTELQSPPTLFSCSYYELESLHATVIGLFFI